MAEDQGGHPIDGQALILATAKASVGPHRLPSLLTRAQSDLGSRLDEYRRSFECVFDSSTRAAFLVPEGHWATLGDRLGFDRLETAAVRRAHEEQLRRLGSETDRRGEFETALEIREVVVVGTGAG